MIYNSFIIDKINKQRAHADAAISTSIRAKTTKYGSYHDLAWTLRSNSRVLSQILNMAMHSIRENIKNARFS